MPATYDCIATTTLGSSQTSVTFSSISGSYTDLVGIIAGDVSAAGFVMQFNGDTGSNYSYTRMYANLNNQFSQTFANSAQIDLTVGTMAKGSSLFHINNYSNTTTRKTALVRTNNDGTFIGAIVGMWRSTSAITSILFSGTTFPTGTVFSLYGIKAA